MQFSTVLNIFIVKTKLHSFFTNDLKRRKKILKYSQSYRSSLFKGFPVNLGNKQIKPLYFPEQISKVLIRLSGFTGWSMPLLLACPNGTCKFDFKDAFKHP